MFSALYHSCEQQGAKSSAELTGYTTALQLPVFVTAYIPAHSVSSSGRHNITLQAILMAVLHHQLQPVWK